jgi:eukaryotic-like serine/threonine-protein kinase
LDDAIKELIMRDTLIGSRINRYEIRESVHKSDLIGIYKAYDTKLERYVLVKTILHSTDYSQEAIDFFLAESRSLAKLAHPNIAKVLDFGYEDGSLYLISEYVPGKTLSELMTGPIPWQTAINILLPLTDALIYAHARGILHRDLKPDNILINSDGQPILSDFSLMRIIEEEETRDMTGTNVGLGSPGYVSPEQVQGLAVDFRSDIYSLGVVFFEMVTGKKLFYATSSMEIVMQHIMATPPKPRSLIPDLPRAVEAIILSALSKDREKRFQSVEAFSNALKAVVEATNRAKTPASPRSRNIVVGSIASVILILAILGVSFRKQLGLQPASSPTPTLATTALPSPTPTAKAIVKTPTIASPTTPVIDEPSSPSIPALPGMKLPMSRAVINADSVSQIVELARWGNPNINQLAFLRNEQVLLGVTSAGIYYFDPQDLSAKRFFDGQGLLSKFTISKDGEWLATADQQGTLRVWNISNGEEINQLKGQAKTITALDFSPDKSKLVFSDSDKSIHLWNLKQNEHYTFEKRHTLAINKVLFLGDNDTVISGSDDFQIMFWDVPSGKLKSQLAAAKKINDMALSSDNQYLALALNDATLQIWDLSKKQVLNKIADRKVLAPFTFITFLPSDNNLLTASTDGYVRIWSIFGSEYIWESTSANQANSPTAFNPIKTVAVAPSGSKFVVGYESGLIDVWDLTTKKKDLSKDLGSQSINRMVISPNDQVLAFQKGNSFVELMSVQDSTQNTVLTGTIPRGNPISPDNQTISLQVGELKLYSLSTTTPQPIFTLYDFPANGLINYSPDSKLLTAFSGGLLNYWSTSSGQQLTPSLKKIQGRCVTLYRQDDSFILAATDNGVIFADANLPQFCKIMRGPRTTSEEFLSDGSIIALALENQLIEVWDVHKSDQKIQLKTQVLGDVLDIAISSDRTLLAAASASGNIEIYNLETLELLKTLNLQTGPVHQVLFSHDQKYLIAGLADGTIRFFGLYP